MLLSPTTGLLLVQGHTLGSSPRLTRERRRGRGWEADITPELEVDGEEREAQSLFWSPLKSGLLGMDKKLVQPLADQIEAVVVCRACSA